MSDDEQQASGGPATIDDSTMEVILDKLRILHYESDFCSSTKPPFKPLDRFYFTGPSTVDNPNAQFYYFTSLCAWLMSVCEHKFEAPGQFDDPNATATTILAELKAMHVSAPNLAPNRIKQGSGETVLTILLALVDQALAKKGFQVRPIDYSKIEKYDELADVADGDEDVEDMEQIDDNVVIDSDDEDEVYIRATGEKDAREDSVVPVSSTIDAEEWNMEVERVAPLLQVRPESGDDWRARVENATVLLKAVEKMYPDVRLMLERMGDEMEKSRDRIQKREQTLAQQFSEEVEEYRVKLRELNTSRDAANVSNQSVQQLTMELNQVSEVLEQMKHDIEDRESKISDTTPLMHVKEAVTKIQAEIKQMALRIGILQNGVLQYVMKQTKEKREGTTRYDEEDSNTMESYYD
ncbi:hypothetical protein STCU_01564 [Strigomonas culicis]|uniref:Intraflagellar transport protein 57 n=1 Tax=Strigomonas culicis TaxID=28005 RepID=S9UII7_9TRYP|nr:hypothetical protein STCU_04888 [Strigomonas culicis]EPY34478.1 hypothetical protein STCU_01564 [Strigomonas culicis]|eukprot:EPY28773.1 hypothetical protein STCU_04888 [Strigomonas culicis]